MYSASCHGMILNKAAITTKTILRMTCTYSKRQVRNYEFIFIFLHLLAVLLTSTWLWVQKCLSILTQKKMWFIVNINEPHWPLGFCLCALDNKLMAVSRCIQGNTISAKAVFPVRFPIQARESAFFHSPCVHSKGSQIMKKSQKQWNPWRFSHYFEWQQSQLGWVLFNILPCSVQNRWWGGLSRDVTL